MKGNDFKEWVGKFICKWMEDHPEVSWEQLNNSIEKGLNDPPADLQERWDSMLESYVKANQEQDKEHEDH